MKILIAPDSFKGTISSLKCAQAIADGWLSERPHDQVILLPMADGGEGTPLNLVTEVRFGSPQNLPIVSGYFRKMARPLLNSLTSVE